MRRYLMILAYEPGGSETATAEEWQLQVAAHAAFDRFVDEHGRRVSSAHALTRGPAGARGELLARAGDLAAARGSLAAAVALCENEIERRHLEERREGLGA